jgi:hypothetical protein
MQIIVALLIDDPEMAIYLIIQRPLLDVQYTRISHETFFGNKTAAREKPASVTGRVVEMNGHYSQDFR